MGNKNSVVDKKVCYLCSGSHINKRAGIVRDNPNLEILECHDCGLIFLSSFSHIDDRFYRESKMHNFGNGFVVRLQEAAVDDQRRYNTLKQSIKNMAVLDFGCGVGGFLMRAKKIASRIQGVEPEESLATYFKEAKLPVTAKLQDVKQKFDFITLFHVLEHMVDPVLILKQLSERLKKGGSIIIEVPNANDALLSLYNCRAFSRFTYWSCHLFLYINFTLKKVAEKAGLKTNFIKQIQRYPLSNHIYWLSTGKPGGHKVWSFLGNEKINKIYEKKLAIIESCDTILASFSKKK